MPIVAFNSCMSIGELTKGVAARIRVQISVFAHCSSDNGLRSGNLRREVPGSPYQPNQLQLPRWLFQSRGFAYQSSETSRATDGIRHNSPLVGVRTDGPSLSGVSSSLSEGAVYWRPGGFNCLDMHGCTP